MNCKKCGRPLKKNEKLCPHCKNKRDRGIKTGIKVGAVIAAIGLGLLKAFGGSKDGKA
jgi:hypothetical protein